MLMLQLGGHEDETIVRGKRLFKILLLSISTGTRKLHICSWLLYSPINSEVPSLSFEGGIVK